MAPSASASTGVIEVALVLAADDPKALAAFYAALVDAVPVPGFSATHWRVALPRAGWSTYRPSRSRPQPPQRGRLAVCLRRSGHSQVVVAVAAIHGRP